MTRAKEANESSKTEPDESKHREDLYPNAGGDNSRYVIDSKAGRSFGEPQAHAISGNGRFVVFSSSATNLIAGGNPSAQVFVRDTCNSSGGTVPSCTPITVLVSAGTGGPMGGFDAAISDDGHFVAFVNETLGPVQQILVAGTGF